MPLQILPSQNKMRNQKGRFIKGHKVSQKWKEKISSRTNKLFVRCSICNREFRTFPSDIQRGGGKFCSKSCAGKIRIGEKNPLWKGNKVGLTALHIWKIRREGNPLYCEHCGEKGNYIFYYYKGELRKKWSIHWANKSGRYLRDSDDWLGFCYPCHKKYDNNVKVIYASENS
jgi:hypothetical protein